MDEPCPACPPPADRADPAADRSERLAHLLVGVVSVASLAAAGVSGWFFEASKVDRQLAQLVFYGCWSGLIGAWIGGRIGADAEEDACGGGLDMGVTSSMGALLGSASLSLIGTAIVGLDSWELVWGVAVALAMLHPALTRVWPMRLRRLPHLDARGRWLDAELRPLLVQPLRMRDRLGVALVLLVLVTLGLMGLMAAWMGGGLASPMMMAAMMYGMLGTMLGGMVGGWLAGVTDRHAGPPEHDNAIMVASMALMAGMMGAMPTGMMGAMMALMTLPYVVVTLACGVLLPVVTWAVVLRGRYRWVPKT